MTEIDSTQQRALFGCYVALSPNLAEVPQIIEKIAREISLSTLSISDNQSGIFSKLRQYLCNHVIEFAGGVLDISSKSIDHFLHGFLASLKNDFAAYCIEQISGRTTAVREDQQAIKGKIDAKIVACLIQSKILSKKFSAELKEQYSVEQKAKLLEKWIKLEFIEVSTCPIEEFIATNILENIKYEAGDSWRESLIIEREFIRKLVNNLNVFEGTDLKLELSDYDIKSFIKSKKQFICFGQQTKYLDPHFAVLIDGIFSVDKKIENIPSNGHKSQIIAIVEEHEEEQTSQVQGMSRVYVDDTF
jgi:hypothetical protein